MNSRTSSNTSILKLQKTRMTDGSPSKVFEPEQKLTVEQK